MLKRMTTLLEKNYVKNGIWLYLLQAVNTVIPLITLPYVTRILGTSGYGLFSVAFNIVSYLQVFVEYGFAMSATREVSLSDKSNRFISKLYSSVLVSRLFLFLLSIIPIGIYVIINKENTELCYCFIILSISLLGFVLQLNWLFQGLQEMKYISITSIIARTISVAMTFLFVKNKQDLIIYCLLYSLAPVLSGLISQLIAISKFNLHFYILPIQDYYNELKNGWYVFTTQMSSKVFGAIGITFLGLFASNADVGIYSAIQKISAFFILLWNPISQVIYPIISKRISEDFLDGYALVSKIRKYVLLIFASVFVVTAIVSEPLVRIAFGAEYSLRYYWNIPLLAWVLVAINNNFYGIQTLLGSGHDREYSHCFQIGVIATILFNFVLIFFFGGDGACIAPLLSELLLGVLLFHQIKRIKESKKE